MDESNLRRDKLPVKPDGLTSSSNKSKLDALNAAIKACHEEHLENDQVTPRMDDDIAYDSAINDCVVAIISIATPRCLTKKLSHRRLAA